MAKTIDKIKRKTIIKYIFIALLVAGLITGGIYAYFLSWWAYIPILNKSNKKAKVLSNNTFQSVAIATTTIQIASPEPTIKNTPVPVTPTPLPTPTPHPGDRDKVFTESIEYGDTEYHSQDLSIVIKKVQNDLITYYTAEVYFRNNENYFSAFSYGEENDRIQKTSQMLEENNGILAVSGDNYNQRDYGIIIRNGILYRKHSSTDIMAIFDDGSMKTYPIKGETADNLISQGALHTYSFGPNLLSGGNPIPDFKGLTSNYLRNLQPRCAVGMIEPYHYFFVVVDGRAPDYSQGVTMEELSVIMYDLGCVEAYNLDGGGSATMVFMGKLINRPQGREHERKIADAIIFKE